VTAYLLAHPPRHPSLRFAGSRLAGFLAADPAAAPFRRRWPWAAELASLEWALVDAFDARDAPPLTRERLAGLPLARWPELRLAFHASVRLLRLAWPVHDARAAWERSEAPPPPAGARPSPVCVWRRAERVCYRALEPLEADLLEAALGGAPFSALCARAAQALGDDAAPAFVAARVGRWLGDELLREDRLPGD